MRPLLSTLTFSQVDIGKRWTRLFSLLSTVSKAAGRWRVIGQIQFCPLVHYCPVLPTDKHKGDSSPLCEPLTRKGQQNVLIHFCEWICPLSIYLVN